MRVSFESGSVTGELLEAMLCAYLHHANPSALLGRLAKVASCMAMADNSSESANLMHAFATTCLAMQTELRKLEDKMFGGG